MKKQIDNECLYHDGNSCSYPVGATFLGLLCVSPAEKCPLLERYLLPKELREKLENRLEISKKAMERK